MTRGSKQVPPRSRAAGHRAVGHTDEPIEATTHAETITG